MHDFLICAPPAASERREKGKKGEKKKKGNTHYSINVTFSSHFSPSSHPRLDLGRIRRIEEKKKKRKRRKEKEKRTSLCGFFCSCEEQE